MNNAVILRKDVRQARVGDRLLLNGREREIVRVRASALVILGDQVPARELLHKCVGRPGVDYATLPDGSQVAFLVR
ncbi:MAG TPA: hypothetical protein VHN11_21185 [Xanthobacteraceae bacterium]|jgi:hypothetical protein|nr:hypothetical protein [Xanthobacteraceae bacterium]